MLDRHFVESFLRLNNLAAQLPDEKIIKALQDAGWSKEESERAVQLLRNESDQIQSVNTMSKAAELLAPNRTRTSEDLSLLLGVDVVVDPQSVRAMQRHDAGRSIGKTILLYSMAIILALVCAGFIMWLFMYYGNLDFHRKF